MFTIDETVKERFDLILKKGVLSHAYLMVGDMSKLAMVAYLAKSCFCDHSNNGLPCLECRNCRLAGDLKHPDCHVIEPVGATIRTESIRQLITQAISSGLEGRMKFFIIKEADKLHQNAANAILKLMEDPPGICYFVLLADHEESVLATIRSRCQFFYFPKNISEIREALLQRGLLPTQAQLLAQIVSRPDDIERFSTNSKLPQIILLIHKMLDAYLQQADIVLFLCAQLAHILSEKHEQELAFTLILLLAKEKKFSGDDFQGLVRAQRIWSANVNFQSALEYFMLQ